jgi:hypothetical protein
VGVGVVLSQGTGWRRIPVWYVVRVSTRNLEMVYTPSVHSWNGIPFSYRDDQPGPYVSVSVPEVH